MFFKFLRPIGFILICLFLNGCTTIGGSTSWPENLPARQIFVDGYLAKRNVSAVDDKVIEAHLLWIKRFYQGTLIYPNGWNRASKLFLDSIESKKIRNKLKNRLNKLGIAIANEWAQDNDIRLINNVNIATWGSAMRTAAEREDHESFITKVESDVNELLAKTLQASQISYQRYYPEEDYDNF